MGLLGAIFDLLFSAADTVTREIDRKADQFNDGYDRGSNRASKMSDDELRRSIKRAKENGFSDMKDAGRTRAIVDEYKNRNNK